jgi:hypothetical protein
MLISEATWLAFAAFSGLRTISYVPQIVRIARDRNGASAISYPTWLLWTGANATTAMYAATNPNDVWLALVSSIYALCCMVVIALTAFKRLVHRRTKGVPSRSSEGVLAATPAARPIPSSASLDFSTSPTSCPRRRASRQRSAQMRRGAVDSRLRGNDATVWDRRQSTLTPA